MLNYCTLVIITFCTCSLEAVVTENWDIRTGTVWRKPRIQDEKYSVRFRSDLIRGLQDKGHNLIETYMILDNYWKNNVENANNFVRSQLKAQLINFSTRWDGWNKIQITEYSLILRKRSIEFSKMNSLFEKCMVWPIQ